MLVYFNYSILNESKWIYLGYINNHKPSAIFKISNLKHDSNHLTTAPAFGPMDNSTVIGSALIGISVEPIQIIDSLTPGLYCIKCIFLLKIYHLVFLLAVDSQATSVYTFSEFCQKMVNYFKFATFKYNLMFIFLVTKPF
jgi:hypothetical protein